MQEIWKDIKGYEEKIKILRDYEIIDKKKNIIL